MSRSQRVSGQSRTTYYTSEEVCVEKKPMSEVSTKTKAKYYGGIVMIIIFGLILLVTSFPYIIFVITEVVNCCFVLIKLLKLLK